MTYEYICRECGRFEVTKSMHDASRVENCPTCSTQGRRVFTPFGITGTKPFEASYYPSLGKVFTNQKELNYHCDKNNLIACGKDFDSGESMQKHFDTGREYERKKAWDKIEP